MPGARKAALQKAYIEDNPHPTGKKEQLDAADGGTFYNVTQRKYHPWFRRFLRARGYYDAEVVSATFDPPVSSMAFLVSAFWKTV